ncbi:unnamed protein product, partial [Didymodactylos carnosus]
PDESTTKIPSINTSLWDYDGNFTTSL